MIGHGCAHRNQKTVEYSCWILMRQRCTNPKATGFKNYGGRGISVCDRWNSFATFLADMGEKPSPRHTLERRDNDGPYSPTNCRWELKSKQSRNRRNTIWFDLEGERVCLAEFARHYGMDPHVLNTRLRLGWPLVDAIATPIRKRTEPRRRAGPDQRPSRISRSEQSS